MGTLGQKLNYGSVRSAVVGDVMLDRFVYGTVSRISPEAPIPVILESEQSVMPGGGANVARNLAALEVRVDIFGVVGDDESGRELGRLLTSNVCISANLIIDPTRPTSTKTRVLGDRQQFVRLDTESVDPISIEIEEELLSSLSESMCEYDVVILSDYAKGVLTPRFLREVIGLASAASVPIIVDPKSSDFSIYAGATLMTPNLSEVMRGVNIQCQSEGDFDLAAEKIFEESGVEHLLITRGAQGMTLFANKGTLREDISAESREVFDVSGAGDTVVSTLGAALGSGEDIVAAAKLANAAAGLVVQKSGTSIVKMSELNELLMAGYRSEDRITLTQVGEDLSVILEKQKSDGLRIVFTNGVFDILHPGHVELLERARGLGDFLVVGLNSDASVKRLKGESRPVHSIMSRAQVLKGLRAVDCVVSFDDDTPLALIKQVRPDVLVKGGDYRMSDVVGKDFVEDLGGKVVLIDFVAGHSTTASIERINAKQELNT